MKLFIILPGKGWAMSKQTQKIKPHETANTRIVLGAPIFGNDPRMTIQVPLGQKEMVMELRRQDNDPATVGRLLATEYAEIMFALVDMGIKFSIALSHEHCIQPSLLEGMRELHLPITRFTENDSQATSYPRDFVTWVAGKLLLLPPYIKPPRMPKGLQVMRSPYAIGGRVLQRRDVVLVNEFYDRLEDLSNTDDSNLALIYAQMQASGQEQFCSAPIQPFRQARLRIGLLPNAIIYGEVRGYGALGPDDHPDRVCGLLEDRQGQLHLIVDPQVYSGYVEDSPPLFGPAETLENYRRTCDGLGIQLHVPSQMTVPAANCFWQAPDGKVLMTSGDLELAAIVASIVGDENLFVTSRPIQYMPAWCKAGIRCLIGEIPAWLL